MCIGGRSTPTPPAALPEAAQLPEAPVTERQTSADKRRRAAASGQGGRGTILTGPRGVTQQAGTATKTLLGE